MTYGDLINVVQTLNTGAYNPENIDIIAKLVLSKIARKKLSSRIKLATLTTGGNTSFLLGSPTTIPDFLAPKTDNDNKFVYYYETADFPVYLPLIPYSRQIELQGHSCSLVGRTLYTSFSQGGDIPATIYFPYYSKYLVLDQDGVTEKETPEANDDLFLLPSEFDDILVDGILLYISRREKQDGEFTKNVQQWEKSLNEMLFLN